MGLKHKLCINITNSNGKTETVLKGGVRKMPQRLLSAILGKNAEILVLAPGRSVESVEIHEIKEGGGQDGQSQVTCRCGV